VQRRRTNAAHRLERDVRIVHASRRRVAGIGRAAVPVVAAERRPAGALALPARVVRRAGVAIVARRRIGFEDAPLGRIAGVVGAGVLIVAADRRADAPAVGVAGVPIRAGVLVVAGDRGPDAPAVAVALVVGGAGIAVVAGGARRRRGDALAIHAGIPGAGVLVVAVHRGAGAVAIGVAYIVPRTGITVVAGVTRGRREDALPFDAGVLGTGVLVVASPRLAGADAVGVAGVLGGAGIAVVADLTLSRGVDAFTIDASVPGAAVVVVAGGADADAAAVGVAGVLRGAGVAVVAGGARGRRGDARAINTGVPGARV